MPTRYKPTEIKISTESDNLEESYVYKQVLFLSSWEQVKLQRVENR